MSTTLSSLMILGNLKVGGNIFCDGSMVYSSKNLGPATTTTQGLMSIVDKQKLDGISLGADKNRAISDSIASTSSTTDASSLAVKTAYDRAVTAETAAKAYADTQINNLVNGAAASLNTLQELATALNNDANFATTVTNSIATKVSKAGDTMTGNLSVSKTDPMMNLVDGTLQIRMHIVDAPTLDVIDTSITRNIMKWNLTDKIPEFQEGGRTKGKMQVVNSALTHGYQWEVNASGELVLSKYL